jgi:hypothetical protein
MENFVAWALTTLVGAFVGSYLASYLKKKGENLATHEDIDKLLEQVSAVTTTTKEIEAKISSDVWDQQKRWELKRDTLFEVTKKIGLAEDALYTLHSVYEMNKRSLMADGPERLEKAAKVYGEWNAAVGELDRANLLLQLTCSAQVQHDLRAFTLFMRGIAKEIANGRPEILTESTKELVIKLNAVLSAMRKEIENRTEHAQPSQTR